jgi:hypothetical protein
VMGPVSTDGGCFPDDYTFRTDAYYFPGVEIGMSSFESKTCR